MNEKNKLKKKFCHQHPPKSEIPVNTAPSSTSCCRGKTGSRPDILGSALAGFPGWCVYLATATFLLHSMSHCKLSSSLSVDWWAVEKGRLNANGFPFLCASSVPPWCLKSKPPGSCFGHHSSPWTPCAPITHKTVLLFVSNFETGSWDVAQAGLLLPLPEIIGVYCDNWLFIHPWCC